MKKEQVTRTVKNGRVKVHGKYYKPSRDYAAKFDDGVQTEPNDGDKIKFGTYIYSFKREPFIWEFNAPVDKEGHFLRGFWDEILDEVIKEQDSC